MPLSSGQLGIDVHLCRTGPQLQQLEVWITELELLWSNGHIHEAKTVADSMLYTGSLIEMCRQSGNTQSPGRVGGAGRQCRNPWISFEERFSMLDSAKDGDSLRKNSQRWECDITNVKSTWTISNTSFPFLDLCLHHSGLMSTTNHRIPRLPWLHLPLCLLHAVSFSLPLQNLLPRWGIPFPYMRYSLSTMNRSHLELGADIDQNVCTGLSESINVFIGIGCDRGLQLISHTLFMVQILLFSKWHTCRSSASKALSVLSVESSMVTQLLELLPHCRRNVGSILPVTVWSYFLPLSKHLQVGW